MLWSFLVINTEGVAVVVSLFMAVFSVTLFLSSSVDVEKSPLDVSDSVAVLAVDTVAWLVALVLVTVLLVILVV